MLAALALDLGLATARSALVNSDQEALRRLQRADASGAGLALRVVSNASRLMSSMRCGQALLRLAVLGLAAAQGWLGSVAVSRPALLLGWVIGAMLLISLGEFACENLALRAPERWARRLAPLAAAAVWLLSPLGWLLQRTAAWLAGPAEGRQHPLITEEAIMTLVDAGEEGGVIEEEEKAMIYSIFQLGDTLAREVMVPRIDILAFERSTELADAVDALLQAGHSRAPVYAGSIDDIVGLLYAKDLLAALREHREHAAVGELVREAYFVPEATKADDLLTEMQSRRVHMAIVVDEYGGTAGLVTIEDIVEEIVGEILDEYDQAEELPYERFPDGSAVFGGNLSLDDVNEVMGSQLPKDAGDTLAGLIFSLVGRVPALGEMVEAGGLRLTVEQVTGRRIRKVRATRAPEAEARSDEGADHS